MFKLKTRPSTTFRLNDMIVIDFPNTYCSYDIDCSDYYKYYNSKGVIIYSNIVLREDELSYQVHKTKAKYGKFSSVEYLTINSLKLETPI